MKIVVQLIENYLSQPIPSIIITIDKAKYIVNIPSCFQRFIRVHKNRFPKGGKYFFTKTATSTIAGLSGLMLTIFESEYCVDSKLFVDRIMFNYL